ncbi:MAG TPA: dihydroorotate oxidase [Patescibacteria group bacterium]
MLAEPFYDPTKSYEENFTAGPFGAFADQETVTGATIPFGIPAGPLINSNFVAAAFRKGFDICVYKTVRSQAYPCHPHPNVLAVHIPGNLTLEQAAGELVADTHYDQPLSITNSFGVPSKDPAWWQADMKKALASAGKGQTLVGSFQGTKKAGGTVQDFIDDYVLAAKLVRETGTKIIEANLSCPNEGTADLLCFDVERVKLIATQIKKAVSDAQLFIKVAYYADDNHLHQLVKEVGPVVDGIAAINTIPATIVDTQGKQALPGEGRLRSGVCGAGIKWAGLDMVKRLAKLRAKTKTHFTIVGVGGVTQPEDYFEYRQAGADEVMSATGAMWNPLLAQEIKMKKEAYE